MKSHATHMQYLTFWQSPFDICSFLKYQKQLTTTTQVGFKFSNIESHLNSSLARSMLHRWVVEISGKRDGEDLIPSVSKSLSCWKIANLFFFLLNMAPPQVFLPIAVVLVDGTSTIAERLWWSNSWWTYLLRQCLTLLMAVWIVDDIDSFIFRSLLANFSIFNLCLAIEIPMLWRNSWLNSTISSSSSSFWVNKTAYSEAPSGSMDARRSHEYQSITLIKWLESTVFFLLNLIMQYWWENSEWMGSWPDEWYFEYQWINSFTIIQIGGSTVLM